MFKTTFEGKEYFTNHQGEGVFTRRADGTWAQSVGTCQGFRSQAAFRRYVVRSYGY